MIDGHLLAVVGWLIRLMLLVFCISYLLTYRYADAVAVSFLALLITLNMPAR